MRKVTRVTNSTKLIEEEFESPASSVKAHVTSTSWYGIWVMLAIVPQPKHPRMLEMGVFHLAIPMNYNRVH